MKSSLLMTILLTISWANHADAALVTINGLQYDTDQFAGAQVTTNVANKNDSLDGSNFDNLNGLDGFALGELAIPSLGGDFGDFITLGDTNVVEQLTLTYGSPIFIGPGNSSLFVVFEQSGDSVLDPEGTNFEISFNGGAFVNASISGSVSAQGGVTGSNSAATEQNQIAFNLIHPDFGFSVGDSISTVTIRNLIVPSDPGEDDPDFLFAARAGDAPLFSPTVVIPEPTSLALMGFAAGVTGLGTARRRRRKQQGFPEEMTAT